MSMRLRTLPLSPFVATHTESSLCVAKCVSATPFSSRSCALFHFPYPVTPVFATHTKTAGCIPTIPIVELAAAKFRFYLNFLPCVRHRSRWSFGHSYILVSPAVVKHEPIAQADHA